PRIARSRKVALIGRRTDDRIGADAAAARALIRLRAEVAVVARIVVVDPARARAVAHVVGAGVAIWRAGGSHRRRRIGAHARTGIARADVVALAERRADDRVGADAAAARALIGLRAQVAVVAGVVVVDAAAAGAVADVVGAGIAVGRARGSRRHVRVRARA